MIVEKKKKIKIFQIIQQNFAILGISSKGSNRNSLVNGNILKALLHSLSYILNATLSGTFLVYRANIFREYIDCINGVSALIAILASLMILFFRMKVLFGFIENCEKIIDRRE